jgi:phage baseplate assembly protein W
MRENSFLGTGWSFPPAFDNSNDRLQMSAGDNNITQSIDLVLQTPVGSRSLLPTFGCSLNQFIFRNIDGTARAQIIQSVEQTLLDCEPRISVESIEVFDIDVAEGGAAIALNILYRIKQTNTRHNHVFPFSLIEGTLLNTGRRALP